MEADVWLIKAQYKVLLIFFLRLALSVQNTATQTKWFAFTVTPKRQQPQWFSQFYNGILPSLVRSA